MENNESRIVEMPDVGVHKATRLIRDEFKEQGYRCRVVVRDEMSALKIVFSGENAPGVEYIFASTDDDNDVAVRSDALVNVPEAKLSKVIRLLNEFNNRFRFVRFCLDKKNRVHMEYDMPLEISDEDVGAVADGILMRMVAICDEAYPELMRAVWAD